MPTSASCTVLIARRRAAARAQGAHATSAGELLAFTDADALRALGDHPTRRPARGRARAAVRGDAARRGADQPHQGRPGAGRVRDPHHLARQRSHRGVSAPPAGGAEPTVVAEAAAPSRRRSISAARAARRASGWRARSAPLLDGNPATLIDLSTIGAQVVSSMVLKPNQRVRWRSATITARLRFNAAVAWASFEIPPNSGPRYRAGHEVRDATRRSGVLLAPRLLPRRVADAVQ